MTEKNETDTLNDLWQLLQLHDVWTQQRMVEYLCDRVEQRNVWGEKEGKGKRPKKLEADE